MEDKIFFEFFQGEKPSKNPQPPMNPFPLPIKIYFLRKFSFFGEKVKPHSTKRFPF